MKYLYYCELRKNFSYTYITEMIFPTRNLIAKGKSMKYNGKKYCIRGLSLASNNKNGWETTPNFRRDWQVRWIMIVHVIKLILIYEKNKLIVFLTFQTFYTYIYLKAKRDLYCFPRCIDFLDGSWCTVTPPPPTHTYTSQWPRLNPAIVVHVVFIKLYMWYL